MTTNINDAQLYHYHPELKPSNQNSKNKDSNSSSNGSSSNSVYNTTPNQGETDAQFVQRTGLLPNSTYTAPVVSYHNTSNNNTQNTNANLAYINDGSLASAVDIAGANTQSIYSLPSGSTAVIGGNIPASSVIYPDESSITTTYHPLSNTSTQVISHSSVNSHPMALNNLSADKKQGLVGLNLGANTDWISYNPSAQKLAYNSNTQHIDVLDLSEPIPKGDIWIDKSGERLFGMQGSQGMKIEELKGNILTDKGSLGLSTIQAMSPSSWMGMKELGYTLGLGLNKISGGRLGYNSEEYSRKMRIAENNAIIGTMNPTGEGTKSVWGYASSTPEFKITAVAGTSVLGGAILAPIGAGVSSLPSWSVPIMTTTTKYLPTIALAGTELYSYKQATDLSKIQASGGDWTDYAGYEFNEALTISTAVKGFQLGAENTPFTMDLNKNIYPYQTGLFTSKGKPILTTTYSTTDEGLLTGQKTTGLFQNINWNAPIPSTTPQLLMGYQTSGGKVFPNTWQDMPFEPSGAIQTNAWVTRNSMLTNVMDTNYFRQYLDVKKIYGSNLPEKNQFSLENVKGLEGSPAGLKEDAVKYLEYARKTGLDLGTGKQLGVARGGIDVNIGGSVNQNRFLSIPKGAGDVDVMINDIFPQTKINVAEGMSNYLNKLYGEGTTFTVADSSTIGLKIAGNTYSKSAFEFPIRQTVSAPFGFDIMPSQKASGTSLPFVPSSQESVNLLSSTSYYSPSSTGLINPQAGRFNDIAKQTFLLNEYTNAGYLNGNNIVAFNLGATQKFGGEMVGGAYMARYGYDSMMLGSPVGASSILLTGSTGSFIPASFGSNIISSYNPSAISSSSQSSSGLSSLGSSLSTMSSSSKSSSSLSSLSKSLSKGSSSSSSSSGSSSSFSSSSSSSSSLSLSSSSSSSSSRGLIPFVPLPFLPPFALGAGLGMASLRDFKPNMKYAYTPSFKALIFNIKGKQPKKKTFTGLEVRPIPKGFSWSKLYKRGKQ